MNRRLQCIFSHIPEGIGIIDVGSDHGYLPVSLAQAGYTGRLIASDIRPGPLAAAQQSARAAGLDGRIEFQLCDGLACCDPFAIDTIVIAGMGGDTICGILDRAEWCMDSRYVLVLQPMTRAEVLRYWLVNNDFSILSEDLVEDGGIVYSVLVARFGERTVLSDAEFFTGSFTALKAHPLFPKFLERQKHRFKNMLRGLDCAKDIDSQTRCTFLRTIQKELEAMTPDDNS